MTYKQFDVVVVPFPFTDRNSEKRRPALIVSQKNFGDAGKYVLLMITTSTHTPWPFDIPLESQAATGLTATSIVRMKVFTLEENLILRRIGVLSAADKRRVQANLKKLFSLS